MELIIPYKHRLPALSAVRDMPSTKQQAEKDRLINGLPKVRESIPLAATQHDKAFKMRLFWFALKMKKVATWSKQARQGNVQLFSNIFKIIILLNDLHHSLYSICCYS